MEMRYQSGFWKIIYFVDYPRLFMAGLGDCVEDSIKNNGRGISFDKTCRFHKDITSGGLDSAFTAQ